MSRKLSLTGERIGLLTENQDADQYGTGGDNETTLPGNESLIADALCPPDLYQGKIFWADLPPVERTKWVNRQYRTEVAREFEDVKKMAIKNPLSPLFKYIELYAIGGVGFSVEGYVLFSVGNILPLFKAVWPSCWKDHEVCNGEMIQAIKYMEIVGIIVGQLAIGYIGDRLGRRWGLIQDVIQMFLGAVLLTAMWGNSLSGWTIMYAFSLFWFSIGVGGEYPMTSTTAMEGVSGSTSLQNDRLHRGRSVSLAFLMQGWGQLFNQLVLLFLLYVINRSLEPPYSELAVQLTFRLSFACSAVALLYFLYLRVTRLRNVDNTLKDSKDESEESDNKVLKTAWKHYWHRILSTALAWFCSDFAFYGNQIFRESFTKLAVDDTPGSVKMLWLYSLINIGCQMVGYYMAALLMDHKQYGRRKMQLVGFGVCCALFAAVAIGWPVLSQSMTGGKVLVTMYFLTNFFIQFGPNSTTFLVAGENLPSGVRSTAHGFSAAFGKTGALLATVIYNYIEDRTKFMLATLMCFIGFIVTMMFVADTTGLDLPEQQRYWMYVLQGRSDQYHGIAVHPQHISWYEKKFLGRADHYDADMDRKRRKDELRERYDNERRAKSFASTEEELIENSGRFDDNVRKYFESEERSD